MLLAGLADPAGLAGAAAFDETADVGAAEVAGAAGAAECVLPELQATTPTASPVAKIAHTQRLLMLPAPGAA